MPTIRTCLTCGKEIIMPFWWIKAGRGKYCNPKCYQKSRKGKQGNRLGVKLTEEHKRKIKENSPRLSGRKHPNWKGGKKKCQGYILIHKPEHPFAESKGYIRKNRLVMEEKLGRYLLPEEVVHHINKIKDDDRPEKLKLFPNSSEHKKFHNNIS